MTKRTGSDTAEHKVFKAVVLILVFMFFMLILYFLKVQFLTGVRSNVDPSFQIYEEKYNYLYKNDFSYKYGTGKDENVDAGSSKSESFEIDECNYSKLFYLNNVVESRPCVFKLKNKHNDKELTAYFKKIKELISDEESSLSKELSRGLTELDKLVKKGNLSEEKIQTIIRDNLESDLLKVKHYPPHTTYLKHLDFKIHYSTDDYKSNLSLINRDIVLFQVKGSLKVALSPITQINQLLPFRNGEQLQHAKDSAMRFRRIFSSKDLFAPDDFELKKAKKLYIELNEGEMLYIPAYFFHQTEVLKSKNNSDNDKYLGKTVSFFFEYLSNSRVLDGFFKILFDDSKQKLFGDN